MMVETLQQLLPGFLIPYFNGLMQFGQELFGSSWQDILSALNNLVPNCCGAT